VLRIDDSDCCGSIPDTVPTANELNFADWIEYVFDRPTKREYWYFEIDQDGNSLNWWEGSPQTIVDYLTRLFTAPDHLMDRYSREQVAQAFWFIASMSGSKYTLALYDESVPWQARERCINSISTLFDRLFAKHCSAKRGHPNEPDQDDPLDGICYMWWDVFRTMEAPANSEEIKVEKAFQYIMELTLYLPSESCTLSALHGLGHQAKYFPDAAGAIIEKFLGSNPSISTGLRRYTQQARTGAV
jgi:hypothetical protein